MERFILRAKGIVRAVFASLPFVMPAIVWANGLSTIYSFNGDDGAGPQGALVQGSDGNFYGTTVSGGTYGDGTVFRISPDGTLTTLHSFNGDDGEVPRAGLAQGNDGNFYGTTYYGGTGGQLGTVFRITPDGTLTTLHSFSGSATPAAALVQGRDGNFYSTTSYGGIYDKGSVFRITPDGTLTTLHSFNGSDGEAPYAALVQGDDGNFYGTTTNGGNLDCQGNGCGTVFSITPDGAFSTLHSFNGSDGFAPRGALVQGNDGNFYGTTLYGGSSGFICLGYGCGTVFRIAPDGTLNSLYSFSGSDGRFPNSLIQTSDGNFYGTTSDNPYTYYGTTLFRIAPDGTLTTLHSFSISDGYNPGGALVLGSDGNFYGTTGEGGEYGYGTVFKLEQPAAATPSFSPAGGTYTGTQTVTISASTSGATIHYTTDGSTPTTSSPTYSRPVSVASTATIKAIAIASGFANSAVASATYTITPITAVATPSFNPAGGTYTSTQTVTISDSTSGAAIHYTTDGSTPSASSPTYTSPLSVSTSQTIKAIAVASDFTDSDVATATYTIQATNGSDGGGGGATNPVLLGLFALAATLRRRRFRDRSESAQLHFGQLA